MKSKKIFSLLFLITFLVSCGKKEIKGDVFIVTEGAGSYKLGLVQVSAIPEDLMKSYSLNKTATEFFMNREKYFNNLPAPIATATTDSDGKFTLNLPKTGRYALAARAERKVMDGWETYYWLVWVSMRDSEPKSVKLSNDNLVESGSLDSVIPIAKY